MELKYKIWIAIYIVGYIIAYSMLRWEERDMCRFYNKQYDWSNVVSVAALSLLSFIVPICVLLGVLVCVISEIYIRFFKMRFFKNKNKQNGPPQPSLPPKFL